MTKWADYRMATSLADAVGWMAAARQTRVVAGATDVIVQLEKRKTDTADLTLIDVSRIAELQGIVEEDGWLVVGAATTMAELASSPAVARHALALAEGARAAASPIIRQVATVGGNLVNASPAADTVPGLIVAGAVVDVYGPDGTREVPACEIQTGPGACSLSAGEIVVKMKVPFAEPGEGQAFLKMGRRKALSISLVNVAARVTVDGTVIKEAAAVLGAVAPTFVEVREELTELLRGRALGPELRRNVESLMERSVAPISDLRASAEYRTKMAGVLAWRALERSYARACGSATV